jgi:hypothetical protein
MITNGVASLYLRPIGNNLSDSAGVIHVIVYVQLVCNWCIIVICLTGGCKCRLYQQMNASNLS